MTTITSSPAPAAAPALSASRFLVAIGNEVGKGLRHAWAERVQILIELPLFISFVLLLSLLLGRGGQIAAGGTLRWPPDPRTTTWLFLGFAVFTFAYLQTVKMFWRLLGEIQSGTLEQTYLSPLPAWLTIAVGRVVAALVETAVVVGVVSLVVALLVGLRLTWRAEALAPLLFAIAGGVGYSLVIAGLTLVWKRVEMLQELLTALVWFVSGAILPLSRLPGSVGALSQPVFLTHPIAALRTTLLDGHPIATWGTGGWVALTATAAGWLVCGVLVFAVCNGIARRTGSLTRY
jgi:ABC-type polysaccharide/polyol phosphate export permease